jgi:membrane protease YdiL (CAAX protease family)
LIDVVLTSLLVVGVPSYMMWKSLTGRDKPPERKLSRYIRSIVMALALDGLLLLDWLLNGRSPAALGLAIPIPTTGVVGIALAVCILLTLTFVMRAQLRSTKAPNSVDLDILPTTATEFSAFVAFSFVVGCSWEVLFRGYLLWALQPHIGLVFSVLLAAAAYGVAHGFKNTRIFLGSVLSALIFTVAYAATGSLWWLMLVHCGLPLIGAFASRAQRRRSGVPSEVAGPLGDVPA